MRANGAIHLCHSGMLPFEVDIYLDTYDGPGWVKRQLRGRSGWLRVSRVEMSTPISDWAATLVAAITDDGVCLGPFASSAFLDMRSSNPREALDDPDEDLDGAMEMLVWDFLGACDIRHLRMLSDAETEVGELIASEQARGERILGDADIHIAAMRRERRDLRSTPQLRVQLADRIAFFENKQSAASAWLVRRLASMRAELMQVENEVFEALQNHGEVEELYTVRWVARHAFDRSTSAPLHRSRVSAWIRDATGHFQSRSALDESGIPDRRLVHVSLSGRLGPRFRELSTPHPEQPQLSHPIQDLMLALPREGIPSVLAQRVPLQPPRSTEGQDAEETRIDENRQRLRTAAQKTSAKRRDEKRVQEQAIADLIDQYPTLELLEARLERVPSLGIKNRRFSRLCRAAIMRLSRATSTDQQP